MFYAYDPELESVMVELASAASEAEVAARGDWRSLRETGDASLLAMAQLIPESPDVQVSVHEIDTEDGARIGARWYQTRDTPPGSAVVFAHGGGMIMGSVEIFERFVARYVSATRVPFLSVDYRLAPESSGTKLAEDVFAALVWLRERADGLGIDPDRIAVMGDSGGGAPAAGAAILARERGVKVAKQILIYPMLDDRNTIPDEALTPLVTWNYDSNFTGWYAVLGSNVGSGSVSPVVAPGRLEDCTGMPPLYIDVGDVDIFRNEDITYALNHSRAGVPIELHVYSGIPHAWEWFAPHTASYQRAWANRVRAIKSF